MQANKQRIEKLIHELSEYTATPGNGITRLTYSKEDLQARNYIKEKMRAYGLTIREDGIGNIFGKIEGSQKGAPSVLVGSHFDSVPNGGAYDGAAGVVTALEVAALFQENKLIPKYPLEIIALIEEEGARFGALMGSRSITGVISEHEINNIKDNDGVSVADAMSVIGLDPSLKKHRDPKTMKAFLELHIEQGPILEEKEIPIGVVQAIVGLTQLEVTVTGRAGHAGTTPMDRRSDALIIAANMISKLPELAIDEGMGTVITIGKHQVFPNGANVIPNKVVFTVDIRSGKEENVKHVIRKTEELLASYQREGIQTMVKQQVYIKPKALNEEIQALLAKSSNKLGIPHYSINSGAGHDAMIFSDVTDVGMIFVPSKNGLSHCPEEWSDAGHLANGADVLYEAVKRLTEV